MAKPLVVVESPTKIRTIKKYLGKQYNVAATVGHIKDLPSREMGIDIEHGFRPKYRTIPGKQKVVAALRKAAGDATDIFLAPDPDREGEAIAWHTSEILKKKDRRFHRILYHELTRDGIARAMEHPETLNRAKYEAQQTRRILDRLVGYQISPLLWRKVKGGLSAGRVQSVAVRIIINREREIQAFESEEYWSISADLAGDSPPPFTARLVRHKTAKIKIANEKSATAIVDELKKHPFIVDKILNKTTRRNPLPPFTTSKLQQEAIRKLRFSAKKTMVVAQQLYEGIELGDGEPVGLITYMRTDSTRIASEAAEQAIEVIKAQLGPEYAMDKPRMFKNRKKVQDAHEAIRPTSAAYTLEKVARYLTKDQMALYSLIWKRFVASQMKQALIDKNTVSICSGDYRFTATGSRVRFPGFLALYQSVDEAIKQEKESSRLPRLEKGQTLKLEKIIPKQHFTKPPPRFSEASLVKELEENGIGRPSTYATILSTIRNKGYVDLVKGYFRPNELGFIVNDLIVESFPDIFDVNFTARMEEDLDRIEAVEIDSEQVLSRFYEAFKKRLDAATEGMRSMKAVGFPTGLTCPECKTGRLHIKMGRNGHFLACDAYPECKYTRNYERDEKGAIRAIEKIEDEKTDKTCPKCGLPMVAKQGRYGRFLACSGYPDCKYTESANGSGKDTGVKCPEKKCDGQLMERTSRWGKTFYGCSKYPDCKYAIWDRPLAESCPRCKAPILAEKSTKKFGLQKICLNRECGYKENLDR